jgi:hypothetical protein
MLWKLTSCGSSDNAFCNGSLENKFCHMSLVDWIFFWSGIFICFFFSTLDLSSWSLFSFCYALEFLCFLQGLFTLAFEKLRRKQKWKHNLSYENPLYQIFTTHNQIMWARLATIYVNCNCTCGLRCLKRVCLQLKLISQCISLIIWLLYNVSFQWFFRCKIHSYYFQL